MRVHRAALPALLLVVGCVSTGVLQNLSAGQVGCSPDEVVVSQENTLGATASWYAQCRGHNYWCSAAGEKSVTTSCKEEVLPPGQAGTDAGPAIPH
jgi:hypothetical protein